MSVPVKVSQGVVMESVGEDLVALVEGGSVLTLTGTAAGVIHRVMSGERVDATDPAVVELIAAGVLQETRGLTRRSVVQLGAVATGAGVVTLALPSVAAASSAVSVLSGVWKWVYDPILTGLSSPPWLRIFDVFLPDDFVEPGGDPSALTALGTEFEWKQSVDEDEKPLRTADQGVVVFWNDPDSEQSGDKEDPLTGPITGSFTWGGVTYQVTFTQGADVEPEAPAPTKVTGNFDIFSDSGITDIEIFISLDDFTNDGSPTAMRVEGLTEPVPFIRFDTEGGRAGYWSRVEGVGDNYAPGEITGTFTWDGEEFEATLQFDPGPL